MNKKNSLRIIKIILIILGLIFLYRYYTYLENSAILVSAYLAIAILVLHYEPSKKIKMPDMYIDGLLIILWALIFIYRGQYWLFLAIVFLFIISTKEWYLTCKNCKTSLQYLKNKNKKEFAIAIAVWIVFIISIFVIS